MAVKTSSIELFGLNITLNFKPHVKYMRLKVAKNSKISLSAPYRTSKETAISFIHSHKEWLIKTYEKAALSLPKDNEFIYLGQSYEIKFDESLKQVFINNNEIYAKNQKMVEKFKKDSAKKLFLELIDKFLPFVNKPVNRVVIRSMSSRWGSCNSKKGYINLNLNLLQKDIKFIEYVVLHELVHLIYPHHQPAFYEFIKLIMPDYKEREKVGNGKIKF